MKTSTTPTMTTIATAVHGMQSPNFKAPPPMTPALGGLKPISCSIVMADDASGSALDWAKAIDKMTKNVVSTIESRLAEIKWGYIAMRDQDVGEKDEVRLEEGTGAELLREQQSIIREGGEDPEETFADTAEYILDYYPFGAANDNSKGAIFTQTSDTKPAKSGRSLAEIGKSFAERKIHLFVVGTPGSNMEEMTKAAGIYGAFFELSDDPTNSEAEEITSRLTATIMGSMRPGMTVKDTQAIK